MNRIGIDYDDDAGRDPRYSNGGWLGIALCFLAGMAVGALLMAIADWVM